MATRFHPLTTTTTNNSNDPTGDKPVVPASR